MGRAACAPAAPAARARLDQRLGLHPRPASASGGWVPSMARRPAGGVAHSCAGRAKADRSARNAGGPRPGPPPVAVLDRLAKGRSQASHAAAGPPSHQAHRAAAQYAGVPAGPRAGGWHPPVQIRGPTRPYRPPTLRVSPPPAGARAAAAQQGPQRGRLCLHRGPGQGGCRWGGRGRCRGPPAPGLALMPSVQCPRRRP